MKKKIPLKIFNFQRDILKIHNRIIPKYEKKIVILDYPVFVLVNGCSFRSSIMLLVQLLSALLLISGSFR